MKLAISNLAWSVEEDEKVAKVLRSLRVNGVELAPTKYWQNLERVAVQDALEVRRKWESQDLQICALQSLLFGRGDLQIFGTDESRRETVAYIKKVVEVAQWLGAEVLVFGSPVNRRRGDVSIERALGIARDVFREIGDFAAERGCVVCLEPNPKNYGCDFITTTSDGTALVAEVDSPGFKLHVDAAGMSLEGEEPAALLQALPVLRHFHISAPGLSTVSKTASVDYQALLSILVQENYKFWMSIEMKSEHESNVASVELSLRYIQSLQCLKQPDQK